MEKQRTREEINKEYTWDLSLIFKTDEEFLNEVERLKKDILKIEEYKNFNTSSKSLYDFINSLIKGKEPGI